MLFKKANTPLIGKVLQELPSCDSTNEWLKHEDVPPGTVVYTLHQKAGKGQRGRQWVDTPGANLALSALLRNLPWPAPRAFILNKAVALAVHDVISEATGALFTLKWPNDVLWRDKKVAGVLIENQLQGQAWQQSIIGIGLNADTTHFPQSLPDATSLRLLTGTPRPPTPFVPLLIKALQYRLDTLYQGGHAKISADYHRHLHHLGVVRLFEVEGVRRWGTITGVDDVGMMGIRWADGTEATYSHGTISWC